MNTSTTACRYLAVACLVGGLEQAKNPPKMEFLNGSGQPIDTIHLDIGVAPGGSCPPWHANCG